MPVPASRESLAGPCRLASLWLTLAVLVLLLVAVVLTYHQVVPATWALAGPLALLAVNLAAAIACNRRFRRNPPLLAFHLALLAVALLATASRMTYLKGWVEVSEGAEFTGELTGVDAGPWHPWSRLEALRFRNDGFTIDYLPGVQRDRTFNQVAWTDADGVERRLVIGDRVPLVLDGYRFYTSFNKGFAPTFEWRLRDSRAGAVGTVHLPSYPANEYSQAQQWTPPGAAAPLWVMLEFDEVILPADRAARFRPPDQHQLIVRDGERRHVLVPGDRLELADGELVYLGLRRWMGYNVYWDAARNWLLAACLLVVVSLGWYYLEKVRSRPWQLDEGDDTQVSAP